MKNRSNIVYGILACVLALVILMQIAFLAKDAQPAPADELSELWSGNYREDREKWEGRIKEMGALRAYEEFKEDTKGKGFGVSHTLAHIFGELLYESEGIRGVSVCDSTFAFGCYHSFFGKAISDKGISVVGELDRACIERWGEKGLGCPHGIGHGIQGYYGDDRLVESLKLCSTLNWKEPIGGCTSGVFMEYNFHTMESARGEEARDFDPSKPHFPCDSIPRAFGQACYYEQPQWWSRSFTNDYVKVGALCSEVEDELMRQACYRGLGNTIGPSTGYEAKTTRETCETVGDDEAVLLCKEGASWAFYAEPSARARSGEVCEGLSGVKRSRCSTGFDLGGDRI